MKLNIYLLTNHVSSGDYELYVIITLDHFIFTHVIKFTEQVHQVTTNRTLKHDNATKVILIELYSLIGLPRTYQSATAI